MSNFTTSPNMGLTVPTVGVDAGPDWASNLNASLSVIDGHDHSPGKGVLVTPAGLNISSDLSFIGNNAISLRSSRYTAQSAPLALGTDLGCVYVSGVDLYYNDISGNQIRITQGGGVAGTPGSITGLTAPASASYVSGNQTFVWQSAVNTPANMDAASYIFRNLVASSKGLTLSPPNAMASNYTITLPSLPAANSLLVMDSSGNISTIPQTNVVPVGSIIIQSTGAIPSGFLACDGSAVSRTTYSSLFGVIGVTYGPGNGTTTFNVPTQISQPLFNTIGTATPSYLHSYWHMDSTGNEPNVLQISGFDLTMNGTVPSVAGKFNLARGQFSSSNYLFWTSPPGPTVYDSYPFAVDGWFNSLSGGTDETLFGKYGGGNGWFVVQNSGQIQFGVNASAVTSPLTYNDGNWHYFAAAVISPSGANNMRLYIDGTLVASTTGSVVSPSNNNLAVGYIFNAYAGYIDDVSYWDTMPVSWASFESIVTARWNGGTGALYGSGASIAGNYMIKY